MSTARLSRRQALRCGTAALVLTAATMSDTTLASPALPTELQDTLAQAGLRGSGVLRFFGLRVYEIRLWTVPGFEPEQYARHRFALELVYDRKLEGEAIAERSIAEMRRVAPFSDEQARTWLALMTQAFPDVAAQDRLLGLHDGQGGVRFFHNGRPTAQIADADYAHRFFGIWLAPQTSAPALRNALLGPSAS
ncbi:chalcone isomerase family protein [Hydrogenophaga electricum]|uniref:Chalcone isomerase domain-containing protein n=1 Tax=Hydrogenophaga electricum TaxID=1230953 RepID=A0ABQ6C7V3_9BURK|nr:chalcone isomerase family protein [Hydrogenophaga electricum]GLS16443.1 hypothetical protein GCM10007935_38830 [Hydrogenophaga electricum]